MSNEQEESVEITDELITMIVRGAYQKHGFDAAKIHSELSKILENKKYYTVIIHSNSSFATSTFSGIEIPIKDKIIRILPRKNVATVDRENMKKWLNDEYGWMTGVSDLSKFRDNIKQRISQTYGESYNIVVVSTNKFYSWYGYGTSWTTSDGSKIVIVCDR